MAFEEPLSDPEHLRLSLAALTSTGPIRCAPQGRHYARPAHHPNCSLYPPAPSALSFASFEAAEAAGHPPCSKCRRCPPFPVAPKGQPARPSPPAHPDWPTGPEAAKRREAHRKAERKRLQKRHDSMTPQEYERELARKRRQRQSP